MPSAFNFSVDSFSISDNCGGIPWELHDYAFRMGRPLDHPGDVPGTVGVYGIGMKRAIFKIGGDCLISTQNKDFRYEVEIASDWVENDKTWRFPVKSSKKTMPEDGTTIVVGNLNSGVANNFSQGKESFETTLVRLISTHFAFIIEKGLKVTVNGVKVDPRPTKLIFSKQKFGKEGRSIKPFIFQSESDGVKIFLVVGLTRPIPSQAELSKGLVESRYSALEAGWTIVCNERAVVSCDRTELTGWGESGVPRFHNQFIAISGVVDFRSDNAANLPTNTTKRGIDGSSILYLQVKNKMREGMRIFTEYTNRWKGRENEAKKQIESEEPISIEEIREISGELPMTTTKRTIPQGNQYTPILPQPVRPQPTKARIAFVKDLKDVDKVADYLFGSSDVGPSEVGEECFDRMLKEAKK